MRGREKLRGERSEEGERSEREGVSEREGGVKRQVRLGRESVECEVGGGRGVRLPRDKLTFLSHVR